MLIQIIYVSFRYRSMVVSAASDTILLYEAEPSCYYYYLPPSSSFYQVDIGGGGGGWELERERRLIDETCSSSAVKPVQKKATSVAVWFVPENARFIAVSSPSICWNKKQRIANAPTLFEKKQTLVQARSTILSSDPLIRWRHIFGAQWWITLLWFPPTIPTPASETISLNETVKGALCL